MELKKIQLSHGYYFEFGMPLASNSQLTSEDLGWEYAAGSLKHTRFENLDDSLQPRFVICPETSFAHNCLIQNLFRTGKFARQVSKIIVDWPIALEQHIQAAVESIPSSICFMWKNEEQSIAKSMLIESGNSKRLFLAKSLRALSLDATGTVACAGSPTLTLTSLLKEDNEVDNLLLAGGLLSFIEGALCQETEWTKETSRLGRRVFQNAQLASSLVVVSPRNAKALGQFLETFEGNEESQILELGYKGSLEACTLSPANLVEYSKLPAFLVREATQLAPVQSWQDEYKKLLLKSFNECAKRYEDWTKLSITEAQKKNYFRFLNRLTVSHGTITPNTFDILLAAQSVVDSNFSFEFLNECKEYPENKNYSALPVVDIPLNFILPNVTTMSIRRFETLIHQKKNSFKLRGVKNKKITEKKHIEPVSEDKYKDNSWARTDHPYYCSFPQEDIFMEEFAFDYKKQVAEKIKAKEANVSELQGSMGDGLDLRETIRNWHKEALMIKEELNTGKADVGSVIFVFHPPEDDEKFSWRSFWLAESHDNSNLMFYASPFRDTLIGPGIAKSEFGGFAAIPIPSYSGDPWNEWYVQMNAQSQSEALAIAGALATEHRSVLYIAAQPPSQRLTRLLRQSGKTIIYVNIEELPSEKLRRIRTFHILAEPGVREYAHKYIRKD